MAHVAVVPEFIEIYGDETDRRGVPLVLGSLCGIPTSLQRLRCDIRRILNVHGWSDTRGKPVSTKCTGPRLHPAYRVLISSRRIAEAGIGPSPPLEASLSHPCITVASTPDYAPGPRSPRPERICHSSRPKEA